MCNGTTYEDNRISKVWLNKPNGNGVYLIDNEHIVVVYGDGFYNDHITVYDDNSYGCNIEHSKTTHKAIEQSIKTMKC